MKQWQLQEAKARFSEMVKKALTHGPQEITVHGRKEAVLISFDEYVKLTGNKTSFVEFMNKSPLKGIDLRLERDRSKARKVDL